MVMKNEDVLLSKEKADDIAESIRKLMHHWHPNDQAADYCCEFCGRTAETNNGEVTHTDDCDGVMIIRLLRR